MVKVPPLHLLHGQACVLSARLAEIGDRLLDLAKPRSCASAEGTGTTRPWGARTATETVTIVVVDDLLDVDRRVDAGTSRAGREPPPSRRRPMKPSRDAVLLLDRS
jgi:hypothetical protein